MATKAKRRKREEIIGVKDLRENLPDYIERVSKGESFTVVKRSRPVFRISAIDEEDEGDWERIIDFTKIRKGGVPIEDVIARL